MKLRVSSKMHKVLITPGQRASSDLLAFQGTLLWAVALDPKLTTREVAQRENVVFARMVLQVCMGLSLVLEKQ